MSKIFTVSYHEVQIAGYRVFASYDLALKEYLKHCITETRTAINSDSSSESSKSSDNFDDMTCILEVQELDEGEYVTTKEYDYEVFQMIIEDIDDVCQYIDDLEQKLECNVIPEDIIELFSE